MSRKYHSDYGVEDPFAPGVPLLFGDDDIAQAIEILEETKKDLEGSDESKSLMQEAIDFLITLPAASLQVFFHSVFRQIGANIKLRSDLSVKPDSMSKSPKEIISGLMDGFKGRLTGNMVSLAPASAIAKKLEEEGVSPHVKALVSAAFDTVAGVAIELKSMSSTIAKSSGVEVASVRNPAFRSAYLAAFLPTFARNFLEWESSFIDIGDESDSISAKALKRFAAGAAFGFLTAFPDSMANLIFPEAAIRSASGSSIIEAAVGAVVHVAKEIASKPVEFLLKSARSSPARMVPCGVAAMIFSDDGFEMFSGLIDAVTPEMSEERKRRFIKHLYDELDIVGNDADISLEGLKNFADFMEKFRTKYAKEDIFYIEAGEPDPFHASKEEEVKETQFNFTTPSFTTPLAPPPVYPHTIPGLGPLRLGTVRRVVTRMSSEPTKSPQKTIAENFNRHFFNTMSQA